jgi:uncharacterized protein YegL
MRRLPIYFLIDISESMVGEQMQLVEEGMASIVKELKTDPYALETAWVSIIVFAGQAKTLVPLQEIVTFYPPKFPIGSGTSLSKGLGHLMYELRSNIVKTTADTKGDWKPIIFLFTDGVPTDETKPAIAEWKKNWQRSANMVAISLGNDVDTKLLSELTENVLQLKNTTPAAFKEFFKWVTASIKVSSVSVESNGSGFELAKLDGIELEKVDTSKLPAQSQMVDPNFVVIAGKCQTNKRPYLMKYKKMLSASGISDFQTLSYRLVGAFQVDNTYFELSDESGSKQKIHTDELVGSPTCPCCGNQIAFAMCSCGGIHCIGDEQMSTCPWCGNQGKYGIGEGGFDVNRTQG